MEDDKTICVKCVAALGLVLVPILFIIVAFAAAIEWIFGRWVAGVLGWL